MVHLRNKEEIAKIRHSCRIVSETLVELESMVKPGVTTRELDTAAEKIIRGKGGVPAFKGLYGFPATLCISVNDEVVHGIPADRILLEGQIVGIDVGAITDGYYGDHARTFEVGAVDEELRQLVVATRESLDLGIAAAVAGAAIGDIGYAVQQRAEQGGYGIVRELVGHGVGRKLHEDPQVPNYGSPGSGLELQEGMCLAIEPMINMGTEKVFTEADGWTVKTMDGAPSAHFEHTIAITSNGPEVLSAYR
ncbi:MAG: type I methionyl aminopeptidase [Candidatus Marinimicrobia bacterium]|nr:type I methionyl aminopeptidase [Candidatus Neomarinimicrobiota bacterium]